MGPMISGDALIPRLRDLYALTDQAYSAAASEARFSCRGCDGAACCTVDVPVHTFTEMHYLRQGFSSLDEARQSTILDRCRIMLEAKSVNPLGDAYRGSVCALSFDGLCGLYHYRPMICRLAGIPHFFIRPDGSRRESGGCERFQREILPLHPSIRIDRTRIYHSMAEIEVDAVKALGTRTAPRTIAEVLGAGPV
jgi:hypothetical protein